MAILSDTDIKKALKKGRIKITPAPSKEQIGAGAIDVTLSNEFWTPKKNAIGKTFDLKKTSFEKVFEKKKVKSILLKPEDIILGKTVERISLPSDICGRIQGRSRYARMGITAHVASSFIQPGSNNRQVLEIVNLSPFSIKIHAGMKICQIVLEKTESPAKKPYSKFGKFSKQ